MINANELRIGNWINYDTDTRPVMVNGISGDVLVAGIWRDVKQLLPVDITSEILEKAGFVIPEYFNEDEPIKDYELSNEPYKTIYIARGKSAYEEGVYVYSGLGDPQSYGFKTSIKYLHQLQNLYFALTGTELLINL